MTGTPVEALQSADRVASVLVVDDVKALRKGLVRALQPIANAIDEAGTVAEALELLTRKPAVVVTDVRLPDGNGLAVVEAAAQIRPPPLVIAISGEANPQEAFDLSRAGAGAYLAKPISDSQLRDAIADLRAERPPLKPIVAAHVGHTLLRELENAVRRAAVEQALERNDGNLSRAAEMLGTTRQTLRNILNHEEHRDADDAGPST